MSWRAVFWVLFGLEAAACLAGILMLASSVPEPLSGPWRAPWGLGPTPVVWEQLIQSGESSYFVDGEGLRQAPHFVAGRALHIGLVALPGMDFRYVPIFTWLLALATCLLGVRLAARSFDGLRGAAGPALLALLGAWLFSPGFASLWLFGPRLRYVVPGLCVVACLLLLSASRRSAGRYVLALLLSCFAALTERCGAVVWIAMLPLLFADFAVLPKRIAARRLVFWGVVGNIVVFSCYSGVVRYRAGGLLTNLGDRPSEVLVFLCEMLGHGLPPLLQDSLGATRVTGAILGLGFVLALVVFLRCRDTEMRRRSAPWLGAALFGIAQGIFTTHHLFPGGVAPPLVREVSWSMFLLPFGLLGFLATHGGTRARFALMLSAAALVPLFVQDWQGSLPKLALERALIAQDEGRQRFVLVARASTLDRAGLPIPDPEVYERLRGSGKLRGVDAFASNTLTAMHGSDLLPEATGELLQVDALSIRGRIEALPDGRLPDHVVLSQQSDTSKEILLRVVEISALERTPGASWSTGYELDPEIATGEGVVIRGYAVFHESWSWARVTGEYRRTNEGWERVE